MADAWVVNASPLIALAHADKLELLEKLPAEIVVPEAVVEEILAGPNDPARRALASAWGPQPYSMIAVLVAVPRRWAYLCSGPSASSSAPSNAD